MLFVILAPLVLGGLFLLMLRVRRSAAPTLGWIPAARWERTDEVITDPFTEESIRVWKQTSPRCSARNCGKEDPPGRPRRPLYNAELTPDQVSPGASAIGPESTTGQFLNRLK